MAAAAHSLEWRAIQVSGKTAYERDVAGVERMLYKWYNATLESNLFHSLIFTLPASSSCTRDGKLDKDAFHAAVKATLAYSFVDAPVLTALLNQREGSGEPYFLSEPLESAQDLTSRVEESIKTVDADPSTKEEGGIIKTTVQALIQRRTKAADPDTKRNDPQRGLWLHLVTAGSEQEVGLVFEFNHVYVDPFGASIMIQRFMTKLSDIISQSPVPTPTFEAGADIKRLQPSHLTYRANPTTLDAETEKQVADTGADFVSLSLQKSMGNPLHLKAPTIDKSKNPLYAGQVQPMPASGANGNGAATNGHAQEQQEYIPLSTNVLVALTQENTEKLKSGFKSMGLTVTEGLGAVFLMALLQISGQGQGSEYFRSLGKQVFISSFNTRQLLKEPARSLRDPDALVECCPVPIPLVVDCSAWDGTSNTVMPAIKSFGQDYHTWYHYWRGYLPGDSISKSLEGTGIQLADHPLKDKFWEAAWHPKLFGDTCWSVASAFHGAIRHGQMDVPPAVRPILSALGDLTGAVDEVFSSPPSSADASNAIKVSDYWFVYRDFALAPGVCVHPYTWQGRLHLSIAVPALSAQHWRPAQSDAKDVFKSTGTEIKVPGCYSPNFQHHPSSGKAEAGPPQQQLQEWFELVISLLHEVAGSSS